MFLLKLGLQLMHYAHSVPTARKLTGSGVWNSAWNVASIPVLANRLHDDTV